ncbi:MarR family winged helix-turn-helix transcriptional regulator [Arenibaculum pallidiluteum]|uniref:MarR family winged helix-turn-helix transcriptional regulator n=1 Tax=Arenibaculum pallidiluteum TaxID=2812559 RepID=UPI001A961264|nr:MarR family transcriptional regulator [Arenibaculum pallidiluteum]
MTTTKAAAELLDDLCRRYHLRGYRSGLNSAQWAALRFFARDITDAKTANALARYQGISRPSANTTVRVLVERGLLNREPSELDARRLDVSLTEAGRTMLDEDPILLLVQAIEDLSEAKRLVFAEIILDVLRHLPLADNA